MEPGQGPRERCGRRGVAETRSRYTCTGGRTEFVRADLDDDDGAAAWRALAQEAARFFDGRIDGLIKNAGIYPRNTTVTVDEETFDQVYGVDVQAPFFLTAAVAPAIVDAGVGARVHL
ncbi:SDR family NAD(P)-dependent oxidoreductase [Streptomyces sp. BE230]|uniref:SDR family NAD(P)-dependent oxidoreductase n=1 Tax=Streptomyces sp. BE230 TaxID=3002526 RepID=UPI002ED5A42C|nr:SDR family NAD(P)-dependent oxidoreductase [Streptomyces sp. BE230]